MSWSLLQKRGPPSTLPQARALHAQTHPTKCSNCTLLQAAVHSQHMLDCRPPACSASPSRLSLAREGHAAWLPP